MTLPLRRLAALGAAAAGLLLLPAAAHAAADPVSVTVTSDCDRYGCSNSLKIAPAGQGRLAVALASVGGRRGDLVITAPESAVQLASQAPDCRTVDPRTVRCAATLGTTPTVTGGPQGDLVDGRALAASAIVDGGAGDDTLVLGTGGGTLKGGPGHDALDGGSGSGASADFTDHRRGLRIDLGRQRMAGGDAGSQDTLKGIDGVIGGAGDDRLTGGPGDDQLTGERGRDVLSGGGGDDELEVDGDDRVTCGAGRDAVAAENGATISATCEAVFPPEQETGWAVSPWRAGRPASVRIPRGSVGEFREDFRIEVRDARGRVLRTIRTRVTDALRRRASRFIVALPRGTSEVRVARRRLSPLVEVRRWERTRLRFRVT